MRPLPTGCRVTQVDTGGKLTYVFALRCDNADGETVRQVGSIEVAKERVRSRVVWAVRALYIDPDWRRQGLATKLYEAAAAEACRRRGRLASTARELEAFSNQFWEKQAMKGRALKYRGKRHKGDLPKTKPQPLYVLRDCPPPASLDGLRRRRA